MGSFRSIVIVSWLGWSGAAGGCFPPLDPAVEDVADTGGTSQDTLSPLDTAGPGDSAEPVDTVAPADTFEPPLDTLEPADTGDTVEPVDVLVAPPAPSGVAASGDRSGDIDVSWLESAGATGYLVARCEVDDCTLASAWDAVTPDPIPGTRYLDGDVAAPDAPEAPTGVEATSDDPHAVVVSWDPVAAPLAPRYAYRVVAVGAGGASSPSAVAVGHRAERPVTGYEVRVDNGAWREVDVAGSWRHEDAGLPEVVAGEASASNGAYAEFVRLAATGSERLAGREHSYQVRAITAYGPASASAPVTGWRFPGATSLRWERSVDTSADTFAPLIGAAGTTFDDTSAPEDGSIRWYRVVVSAAGAADAASVAVPGARQPPPGVAGGVWASEEHAAYVVVTWAAVPGALGYHVYRSGVKLTTGGGVTGTSFQDLTAAPPEGAWSAPSSLAASTNDTEAVNLSWTAPARPLGPKEPYQVQAVNAAGDGPLSAAAVGRTAAPALTSFEVEVRPAGVSASWYGTGDVETAWNHLDPPKATIAPGSIAVTGGDHRAFVRLTSTSASVGQAPSVTYRVRGLLADGGQTPISVGATGRRAVGTLVRQWQRTTGASATGFFGSLSGATGVSFDDPGAPSDGAKRWYRLSLSAPGADARVVGPSEGWRLAFTQVDGGDEHTCALASDGRVWCWGAGDRGQLGRGAFEGADPLPPGRVPNLSGVISIHAGRLMTCARTQSSQTWCWGSQPYLGNGTTTPSPSPVNLPALAGASAIAIAESHACAVVSGVVKCWGSADGRLGNDSWDQQLSPVAVRTGANTFLSQVGPAAEAESAWGHSCARLVNGDVWCWGPADCGRLGVPYAAAPGGQGWALVAVKAMSNAGAAELVVGADHGCARLSTGVVHCWGCSYGGLLGDGGVSNDTPTPVNVNGLSTAVQISSSWRSTCARLTSGEVRCWGENTYGELGNGSAVDFSADPVSVALVDATELGSGQHHHCAISTASVYCWGANWTGQLGQMVTEEPQGSPILVNLP